MESKHTPGPWFKETRQSKSGSTRIVVIIPTKYGERIIERELILGHISDDDCLNETCCCIEEHANAKLIAASPKLLESLKGLLNFCQHHDIYNSWTDEAKQAINEAEGE